MKNMKMQYVSIKYAFLASMFKLEITAQNAGQICVLRG